MKLDQSQVKKIIEHIADINAGECNITNNQVEQENNILMRDVLAGLLVMHEDLKHENTQRKNAQNKLSELNEILLLEKNKLLETRISKEYSSKRIKDAIRLVMLIGARNFSEKMSVSSEGDEFDGLAVGLNMLGEELESSSISIDYLNDVLDSVTEVLMVTDNKGQIILFNTAAKYNFGNIDGKKVIEAFNSFQPEINSILEEKALIKLILEKQKVKRFEIIVNNIKGESIPLEISISPMKNNKGLVIIGRNISERKYAEKEREKLLSQLYNSNDELKEMMYIVSHDLKAPLRGISTLSDWIIEDLEGKVDESVNENLIRLSNRVTKMYHLLEGILGYSKIGNEFSRKEEFDLNQLIHELIETLENKNNVKIIFDTSLPTLNASKIHFIQLFQNLISNAIKYIDKPEGRINIGCSEKPQFWQFYVKDNGCGIEKKQHEKIFKIFQTLHKTESFENTGIGLSIVKKIVTQNNGEVWIESELTKGTTFFFTIQK
ncbi:MAG: ATP-binding protein [Cyclobacteriaceae bacterium]|nr:ATP-binding protein [Cyclobacteriaceae bacterium]